MKKLGILATLVTLVILVAVAFPLLKQRMFGDNAPRPVAGAIPVSEGTEDDPGAQAEMEFMMLRDPRTNTIPRGIRRLEAQFARTLPRLRTRTFRSGPGRTMSPQALTWTERGPNNVGGRTRAFAIDLTNPTTLLAGSVAGGIWRSIDDGASWSLRTGLSQIHGTTCIAQDRRSGSSATWYVGTGEIRGSTTNATRWGSLYVGDGIFKSTDSGASWALLPATASGTPQVADAFDYVVNIATNPANATQDEVLAATFKGIYRTTNGGGLWAAVLPSDSGLTDVAVTATGVSYACTRLGSQIRILRSTNGTTWNQIQPASFPTVSNRVVIGLAPSNPQVVYFLVQGANNTPAIGGHQLWKYTYLSGNGSGAGGSWVNRGANLPGDINTQTGYDQIVHVKPDDENFVVIGGTNLYRSTNGFATNAVTTVIGGYPFYPDGNHHPDLHAGAFSPANFNVYYSAGDGGIAKAPDITVTPMVWQSLNHGYNVTQFYSVAIAPDAGSDLILAGAQDNGSQLGNAPGASDWVLAFGGDGTIVEVSPQADDRLYTQYQNGPIQRQNWDGSNVIDMTPTGAANQMFVNPIALDPNVSQRLYYAAGNSSSSSMIWRNDDAPNAFPIDGWSVLTTTDVGAGVGYARRISALGASTANTPNTVYYGTVDGIVKRADDIHTSNPWITDVTPIGLGAGTLNGGFVRCIAVDPTDANHAVVAFGNYNFPSLWQTTDGGTTWTDVEGNLAGATGPSVRWVTLFYVGDQLEVFLGTSIGVLSTSVLDGAATTWELEATDAIGNVIVGYMDYRAADRTLAIGTHGRGVFTTQIPPVTGVGDPPDAGRISLGASYPNPTIGSATIPFALPRPSDVSLRLYDVAGREVAVLVDEPRAAGRHEVWVATDRLATGAYYYVLRAGSATETRTLTVRR